MFVFLLNLLRFVVEDPARFILLEMIDDEEGFQNKYRIIRNIRLKYMGFNMISKTMLSYQNMKNVESEKFFVEFKYFFILEQRSTLPTIL